MAEMATQSYDVLEKRVRAELANGRLVLPSLPEIVSRINQAVRDPDAGMNDVARIIQADPVFTARLIQIANSPSYRTGGQIDSCVMAVMRLGLEVTRNIVTCLALHNVFDAASRRYRTIVQGIWRRSTHVGAISFVLGQISNGIDENKAMLGGLVHDIGYLPLLHYAQELELQVDSEFIRNPNVHRLSGEVGYQVLCNWHFHDELVHVPQGVVAWAEQGDQDLGYTDVVIVAKAHDAIMSSRREEYPPLLELPSFHKMSLKQMGPAASLEVIDSAREEILRLSRILLGS